MWNTGNDWSRYSLVQGTLLNKQFQFGIDWNLLYNPSISPCSTFQDGKPLIGTTNVAFYKVGEKTQKNCITKPSSEPDRIVDQQPHHGGHWQLHLLSS